MKRFEKLIFGVLIATAIMVIPCSAVFAEGKVSVTGDKESASVGDTYTVNVNIENAEGDAKAPEVSVNYDVNRLQFVSCSTEYGGGGGGFITLTDSSAEIVFNILSGGQADVDVLAIFDGDGANQQVATASVIVDGEDTASLNENARDGDSLGVEAGSIDTGNGFVVSTVFADEFMPIGFSKTTATYEEQMVEAAQFDMGNIILLYVTDTSGNNGNFKVYDQNSGTLSDFLQISGIENRFIIALTKDDSIAVPDGFSKATLQWNDQMLEAYTYTGGLSENASVPAADFFLLYAVSSEGNTGWYLYDQKEGTYQRYIDGMHGSEAEKGSGNILSQITGSEENESDKNGGVNVMLIIVIALAVLMVALIITVIVMGIKLHEFNSYDYIDEDEDDGSSYLERLTSSNEKSDEEGFKFRNAPPAGSFAADNDLETGKEPVTEYGMPKSDNIYEKYREEDKAKENTVKSEKANETTEDETSDVADMDEMDDADFFSPREKEKDDLTREDKKALKQEEKARKKAEKKLKKEYGEFGPVDWQSWQDAVEGGEKTAAHAINNTQDTGDEDKKGLPEPVIKVQEVKKPEVKKEEVKKPAKKQETVYEEPQLPKDNPIDMLKKIPANDNKAPVQSKPVQQFDLDDDFEFEFLSLDEDE